MQDHILQYSIVQHNIVQYSIVAYYIVKKISNIHYCKKKQNLRVESKRRVVRQVIAQRDRVVLLSDERAQRHRRGISVGRLISRKKDVS